MAKAYFLIALSILFSTATHSANAQETTGTSAVPAPSDDLLEMDIEHLLNVKVSVASKKEEKSSDAPASVTVYASKDMEKMGYYSVSELADITAGYSANTMYGNAFLETRGLAVTNAFNSNNHLLLLDGIPINHSRVNSALIDSQLPLYFAERVEFLKGPASALYGTSAFLGVVSMVPKKLSANGAKTETKITFGGLGNGKRVMSNTLIKSERGETLASVGVFSRKNTGLYGDYTKMDTPGAEAFLLRDRESSQFAYIKHSVSEGGLKGFTLGSIYMNRNSGMWEYWMGNQRTADATDITWQTFIPYFKYDRVLSDSIHLNAYAKANYGNERANALPYSLYQGATKTICFPDVDGCTTLLQNYNELSVNYETQFEFDGKIDETSSWIAGLSYDTRRELGREDGAWSTVMKNTSATDVTVTDDGEFQNSSDDLNTYSVYAQYKKNLNFLNGLNVTAGLREDMGNYGGKNSFSQLSPRVGFVQKFSDEVGIKLLYGTALRAPSLKERQLNKVNEATLTAAGLNANVKPETISTVEVGPTYNNKNVSLQLVAYQTEVKDAIGASGIAGVNAAKNTTGTTKSTGIEFESRYMLNRFSGLLTYSTADSKDPDGNKITAVPSAHYSVGAGYTFLSPVETSVYVIGRGVTAYQLKGTEDANRPMKAWSLVDLNVMSQVTRDLSLELQCKNIGNAVVYKPYWLTNSGTIPQGGTQYFLSATYRM